MATHLKGVRWKRRQRHNNIHSAIFNEPCSEIISKHGGVIHWADSCRYLGVNLVSGRFFRCSLDESKSRFFLASNTVFGKVGHFASDPVLLGLIRAKCIPILLYGIETLSPVRY
jgi:hypothetical protein